MMMRWWTAGAHAGLRVAGVTALFCSGAFAEDPAAEADPESPCAFGFCMGQDINAEHNVTMDGVLVSTFGAVYVFWTHATGVCAVRATHAVRYPDEYGVALRSEFDRLTASVRHKYGEPSITRDLSKIGSLWDVRHWWWWLKGLEKGERILVSLWDLRKKGGGTRIIVRTAEPRVIVDVDRAIAMAGIEVERYDAAEVNALREHLQEREPREPYVVVTHFFDNYGECEQVSEDFADQGAGMHRWLKRHLRAYARRTRMDWS